jgi:hypothetical protein
MSKANIRKAKMKFPKRTTRRPGLMRGRIRVKKNFDRPLPKAILALFEGRS